MHLFSVHHLTEPICVRDHSITPKVQLWNRAGMAVANERGLAVLRHFWLGSQVAGSRHEQSSSAPCQACSEGSAENVRQRCIHWRQALSPYWTSAGLCPVQRRGVASKQTSEEYKIVMYSAVMHAMLQGSDALHSQANRPTKHILHHRARRHLVTRKMS